MTEAEYNKVIAELNIAAEIFESAMWTIKFTLAADKSTDAEKLQQIQTIVSGAFRQMEEEENSIQSGLYNVIILPAQE